MREPNTQHCSYFGRKLSNLSCDQIEVNKGYVVIGSDNDDEIYFSLNDTPETVQVKERGKIYALYEPDEGEGHCIEIDLEDVLRFSAQYCRGLYEKNTRRRGCPE